MLMKKVLLVDDNEMFRFLNGKILEKSELTERVESTHSAREALVKLREMASSLSDLPDVVILDLMMPDMDGLEFIQQFTLLPDAVTNNVKIALLSSYISPEDKALSLSYDAVIDVIDKPLNKEKLLGMLEKMREKVG
jgi:CheY-like chemotaxis protein